MSRVLVHIPMLLALDLSTKPGYALYSLPENKLWDHGAWELPQPVLSYREYPWCYMVAAGEVAARVETLIYDLASRGLTVTQVAIEETNLGRSRYSQKILEFIHLAVLQTLHRLDLPVAYVSSSSWRKTLEIRLSKEQKKNNARLAKAKREGVDKRALGIKGKITTKHLSVLFVNDHFGFDLRLKDNDRADAICVGLAFLRGAELCDGT